eukprot:m.62321 g.62321  ORF g.62321 m.62321 type:complete len:724 (-) comp15794_c0_seq2:642-2813(-)
MENHTFAATLVGILWFLCHGMSNIALKQAVLQFADVGGSLIDLLFFQLFISVILGKLYSYTPLALRRTSVDEKKDSQVKWTQLIPIAACHVVGTVMTDMSYVKMTATVTLVLKSAEPIFTVVLSTVLLDKQYGWTTLTAVVCVVTGVVMCVVQSKSISMTGVVYACISNAAFPLRNVLTKKIQVDKAQAPWEVFTALSTMSAGAVGVVWALKVSMMGMTAGPVTLVASVLFGSYQLFSFGFLGMTSALTHAICNVVKRVVTMTVSVWFFGDVLGTEFFVGAAIALIGLTLYTLVGKGIVRDPVVGSGVCISCGIFVLLLVGYSAAVFVSDGVVFSNGNTALSNVPALLQRFKKDDMMTPTTSIMRETHLQCLNDIKAHTLELFRPHLRRLDSVLLTDPAFHSNVGDVMLTYGELCLLSAMNISYTECTMNKWERRIKQCGPAVYKQTKKALWHAGGNWGDLWKVQRSRLKSFKDLTASNIPVLGMPQSFHYDDGTLQANDTAVINTLIADGLDLTLSWRQQNSFDVARSLYGNATQFLSPDIAFMIGPVTDSRAHTKTSVPNIDILFLLRDDKESVVGSHTASRRRIRSLLQEYNISWELVDWDDRLRFYNASARERPPMQQVPVSRAFDFNERIASSVAMYGAASVIVTDRLHGSILAFLMNKPHVYLDQVNHKLTRTREVAFRSSVACRRRDILRYTDGTNIDDAVGKAVTLLRANFPTRG